MQSVCFLDKKPLQLNTYFIIYPYTNNTHKAINVDYFSVSRQTELRCGVRQVEVVGQEGRVSNAINTLNFFSIV